jgi:hypothetical protein
VGAIRRAASARHTPIPYYHVVFTLPAASGALAFANKAVLYDLLFKTGAYTRHVLSLVDGETAKRPDAVNSQGKRVPSSPVFPALAESGVIAQGLFDSPAWRDQF